MGQSVGVAEVEVEISKDSQVLAVHPNSLDFIRNTVAAPYDLDPFSALLKRDCMMTLAGAPEHPHPVSTCLG